MLTVKELEKLSRRELRARADEIFNDAETRGPGYLIGAQFYIGELARRADSRTSIRDLILEIIVIGMIGWEIWVGYRADDAQRQNFKVERAVLENLRDSSSATAQTLVAVKDSMDAVKVSLQEQVKLYYDVQLVIGFDDSSERLLLTNTGHGRVSIMRVLMEAERVQDIKYANPQVVAPSGVYFIPLKGLKDYLKEALPKDGRKQYPLTILLKNEKGEKITATGNIIAVWFGDSISIVSQTNTIAPGWTK